MIPLSDIWGIIGIWIVVTILHELGHAVSCWVFVKDMGRLKIRWWGVEFIAKSNEVYIWQDYIIRFTGIMVGYFAALLLFLMTAEYFTDKYLFPFIFIYSFACIFDIKELEKAQGI
jgi:hypothetical protein